MIRGSAHSGGSGSAAPGGRARRIEMDEDRDPVRIDARVMHELCAHALEAQPEECCGLVIGRPSDRFSRVVRCRNEMTARHKEDPAAYPRDGTRAFYMSEADYLRAMREAEAEGHRVTAVYHSHVGAGAYLSEMDLAFAEHAFFPFPDAAQIVLAVWGSQRRAGRHLRARRRFRIRRRAARGPQRMTSPHRPKRASCRWTPTTVLAAASAVFAVACLGGGVRLAELPAEPIAVLYWNDADARSRLEIEQGATRERGPVREGVARLDDLREWVQGGTLLPALSEFPGELVLVDPRTGKLTPVEGAPPGAQPLSWSADRKRLLFAASRRGNRRFGLFEFFVADGEIRPVVPASETVSHPRGDYGPSSSVAYASFGVGRDARPSLWIRPTQGRAQPIAALFAETVRWSPRDPFLVVGERSLDPTLRGARAWRLLGFPVDGVAEAEVGAAVDGEGDTPRRQAEVLGAGRHPTFSPDGAWIVYSAPAGSGWRLQRMRPDGSARSPVGKAIPSRNEQMPSVSPDGRYVAFVAEEGGLARLFVRSMDGSGERYLVGHGAVSVPVW